MICIIISSFWAVPVSESYSIFFFGTSPRHLAFGESDSLELGALERRRLAEKESKEKKAMALGKTRNQTTGNDK